MKKSLLLISIIFFSLIGVGVYYSVSHFMEESSRVVIITGSNPEVPWEVIRGVGYRVDDSTIVTSAHVVPDDRLIYQALIGWQETTLIVTNRFGNRDIAFLSPRWSEWKKDIQDVLVSPDVKVGDSVYIPVFRSGSLVKLTARVQDARAEVIAYDNRGQTKVFAGIILPDTPFLPGDSGAPIFTMWGKLIDVVHVGN